MTSLGIVAEASRTVAETASRTAKVAALAACLRRLSTDEVEIATAFLSGEPRQGKLGVGYAVLMEVRSAGAASEASLTLEETDEIFTAFTLTVGRGSSARRVALLRGLFERATPVEQDFLVRLLVGELRQGALEGVMLDAIAVAASARPEHVRRAAMYAGSVPVVARVALTEGTEGLARFQLEPMRPIAPMLSQTAENVADAIGQLGKAALEWKLDGARVQVHKGGDFVRVYTRNLNEVTGAVPEIVEALRAIPARELVLDGEAIALRPGGAPRPFQVTMRRFGRKLDVEALRTELPLSVYFFDCLQVDGEALVDRPYRERFEALMRAIPEPLRIPRIVTDSVDAAQSFYDNALARGHEGVMAKALDAPYEAGRRGAAWLKIKRAHTLDLVVLAAEWGNGRRQGWLSNLHLGARDPASGGFVMLGKTFKGLTDELLRWQTQEFLAREVRRDDYTVWVRPELVVEIAFNDLQQSPQYPGGLALRFARVKGYRPDKRPEEADTIDTVRSFYTAQLARGSDDGSVERVNQVDR
jgi:DNA ligase-1